MYLLKNTTRLVSIIESYVYQNVNLATYEPNQVKPKAQKF